MILHEITPNPKLQWPLKCVKVEKFMFWRPMMYFLSTRSVLPPRCAILEGLEKEKNTQLPIHLTAVTSIFFIQNFDEYHLQKQTYNITGYSKKIKIKNF
jgi:hypothetical protein